MNNDVVASPLSLTAQNRLPRRCSSISKPVVVPINLSLLRRRSLRTFSSLSSAAASASSSVADFDLISIKPSSYTSLRDLLPSTAVSSPKPNSPSQSGSEEISIKNRLVKQAAWAYLQPMSTTPDSSGRNFFHRLWIKLLGNNSVTAFRSFFNLHVFRRLKHAFDWLLRAVRFHSSRESSSRSL